MNKRLISLLLTLMMIASLAVPVSAAGETTTLNVLAGKSTTNQGLYGSADVYTNYMNASLNVINTEAATYTWDRDSGITDTTKMTDGDDIWNPDYNKAVWLSNPEGTSDYTITFDLGRKFVVNRFDIHSLDHNQWIYVSGATVKVGDSLDAMVSTNVTLSTVEGTGELARCIAYIFNMERALEGRYVQITITAENAPVSEIMVFGSENGDTGIYSSYSVTGYDIPTYIKGLYGETAEFAAISETVNNLKKTKATVTVTNKENSGDVDANLLNGTYASAGNSCMQMKHGAGSTTVTLDLGKVQNVDRISVFSRGTDKHIAGNINTIDVQTSATGEDGTWTSVQTASGSTTPVYESTDTVNYVHDVKLDSTVSTKYLRLVVGYYNSISLGQICVMSKTVQPAGETSWSGRTLTLLSDNVSVIGFIPDVAGLQTVATGAKYKYVTTDYTEEEEKPDAEGWFSSTTADLKDGGCGDGAGSTNTAYDNPNMSVIWDLGSTFALDRLDIVSEAAGNGSTYGWLGGTTISVSDSENGPWTEVCNVPSAERVDAYVGTDGNKPTDTIFDLRGAEGRYLKVEMNGRRDQLCLGEMYIFGGTKSATTPVFVDMNGLDYKTESQIGDGLFAKTTFSRVNGTLIVAWYDSADVLKKVYTATGTGEVSIDMSADEDTFYTASTGNGDKMKAFAFESMASLNSLGSAVSVLDLGK